jgi:hypothetical protein
MKWIVPLDFSFVDFGADRKAKGEKGRRVDLLQYLIDAQDTERENGDGGTSDDLADMADMAAGKLTDKAGETEACVFLYVVLYRLTLEGCFGGNAF